MICRLYLHCPALEMAARDIVEELMTPVPATGGIRRVRRPPFSTSDSRRCQEDDVSELRVFAGDIAIASGATWGHASSGPTGTEPRLDCGNFDPINRNLSRYSFVVS